MVSIVSPPLGWFAPVGSWDRTCTERPEADRNQRVKNLSPLEGRPPHARGGAWRAGDRGAWLGLDAASPEQTFTLISPRLGDARTILRSRSCPAHSTHAGPVVPRSRQGSALGATRRMYAVPIVAVPWAVARCLGAGRLLGGAHRSPGMANAPEPSAPVVAGSALAVASNSWLTRKDMWSTERRDLTAATVTNAAGHSIVYVIGGRTTAGASLGKVMAYDATTNTWTTKASLPWSPVGNESGRGAQGQDLRLGRRAHFTACATMGPSSNCMCTTRRRTPGRGKAEHAGRIPDPRRPGRQSAFLRDVRPDRRHRGPAIHSE